MPHHVRQARCRHVQCLFYVLHIYTFLTSAAELIFGRGAMGCRVPQWLKAPSHYQQHWLRYLALTSALGFGFNFLYKCAHLCTLQLPPIVVCLWFFVVVNPLMGKATSNTHLVNVRNGSGPHVEYSFRYMWFPAKRELWEFAMICAAAFFYLPCRYKLPCGQIFATYITTFIYRAIFPS